MSTISSRHLGARQLHAIEKIGDRMIPGDVAAAASSMPSFSASGCVRDVDRILDYMPASDLADLKTLLTLLGLLPGFVIGGVLRLFEWMKDFPGPIGAVVRLIRIGLRGIVMSLYYSNERVHAGIGYDVGVYLGDRSV